MDNGNNDPQIFSTLDAYRAGYLTLTGHSVRFQKDGQKIVFYFSNSDKLRAHLKDYENGAKVPAIEFARAVKELKSQICIMRGQ